MAKITHSELAPAEKVVYTLANEQFELTAKGTHETDDPIVISNAIAHPWLEVEHDAVEADEVADDAARVVGLAVEAGQDQKEALYDDGTPVTLAADDEAPDFVDEEGEEADEPPTPDLDPEPEYDEERI
jgi:hypothetical protein